MPRCRCAGQCEGRVSVRSDALVHQGPAISGRDRCQGSCHRRLGAARCQVGACPTHSAADRDETSTPADLRVPRTTYASFDRAVSVSRDSLYHHGGAPAVTDRAPQCIVAQSAPPRLICDTTQRARRPCSGARWRSLRGSTTLRRTGKCATCCGATTSSCRCAPAATCTRPLHARSPVCSLRLSARAGRCSGGCACGARRERPRCAGGDELPRVRQERERQRPHTAAGVGSSGASPKNRV